MSIDALVNPLSQRSSSILFAALKALMDFDPKDDQIQSLSNGIAHKFDQSMRTPLLNLDKLALIVENLKILSKFLFPHQIVSLVGKYFQYFYPQLLDTLDSEPSEPLEVQIRAYNKIVLLFQKLLTILELKPNSNENQNQSEHIFPNLYPTMKNLFLDVIDDSNDVKQKHSILLYRRSSLVRFLNQFSNNLE